MQSSFYWSATTDAGDPGDARGAAFCFWVESPFVKTFDLYVRAVRSSP